MKIERIFSLATIITNLKRCHLQTNYLAKFIFVRKNWPNNLRVGCCFTNLVELIEVDAKLEELEEFEGCFDRYEIKDM
jgi:hypothetical protein